MKTLDYIMGIIALSGSIFLLITDIWFIGLGFIPLCVYHIYVTYKK